MLRTSLQDLADEIGVPRDDVIIVATIELDPDDYDEERDWVSTGGRDQILTHFRGGTDQ